MKTQQAVRNKVRRCKISDDSFIFTTYKHDGRGGIEAVIKIGDKWTRVSNKAKLRQIAEMLAVAAGCRVIGDIDAEPPPAPVLIKSSSSALKLTEAVAAEREACARVAEIAYPGEQIARQIRHRSWDDEKGKGK